MQNHWYKNDFFKRFICMRTKNSQINLFFTKEVLLLASFWKRDFLELRNGLFFTLCKSLSQSMSFLLFKPVPQRKQDIKKSLFPQADIYSLFFSYVSWHYVVQLFLVCKMCEIFHHSLLSSTKIACATDEIKLLFRPSGKQGQNPQLCTKIWVLHNDLPVTSATVKL